ncbi:SDR family NAD(P)-dependent oxidoreductase [Nostoc sp. CMAA1605]|uniref:SDR family NAD(P)-dependent oxidoreductase n=1 Tax=Nostoc sp. CMAA1605 TaxID=2055159 RepID=UPI001F239AF8|nr:SDR family oxidoreductase [Nostoc sp. CMAA1605]MCF4969703.1 short-chain dehydrogenase [Nostoc sp. CMAA1605]
MNSWQKRIYTRYGTWAVVTGASSGIGREMAFQLAESGFNLILCARSQETLKQIATTLTTQYSVEVQVFKLDFSEEKAAATLEIATQNLDVGLLIVSAGFGTSGSFLNSQLEQEIEMLNVNCRALLELSWYFGRQFVKRGRGGIVLMSSIVGFQGMPFAAHYAATKAYVQTLAEALYVELAPLGVDVLSSAPAPTNSGFASRAGMRMGMAMNPLAVVQPTLKALGRQPTILPGILSKFLTYSLSPLPRWARVRIMGRVMEGMTKHQVKTNNIG